MAKLLLESESEPEPLNYIDDVCSCTNRQTINGQALLHDLEQVSLDQDPWRSMDRLREIIKGLRRSL